MNWCGIVPFVLHPIKVQIIEAMLWTDRAMSAVELEKVFDKKVSVPNVSYHLKSLATMGVLTHERERKVRGAREHFYFLATSGSNSTD